MAKEIKLPQLGQTMEEGTIVNCLVEISQKIKKGDYLFEIETDKVTLELESPAEGFAKAIIAEQGQTLPVGQVLLILGEEDEKINIPFNRNKKIKKTTVPIEKTPAEKITQADINAAAQGQTNYKLGQKVPLNRLTKITSRKNATVKARNTLFLSQYYRRCD